MPNPKGPNQGDTLDDDVLTHEMIHFLRARDKRRKGVSARAFAGSLGNQDSDVEEAFTDSETLARTWQAPTKKNVGYHAFIKGFRKELEIDPDRPGGDAALAKQGAIFDKMLFQGVRDNGKPLVGPTAMGKEVDETRKRGDVSTDESSKQAGFAGKVQRDKSVGKMFRGIKGLRAARVVERQFPNIAMSHTRLKGRAEVRDTYWKYTSQRPDGERLTVLTHIYSPNMDLDRQFAIRHIANLGLNDSGAGVQEFQDRQLVKARP